MSFLLWQREGNVRFGASRLVMRAREVPLFKEVQGLRERLQQMNEEETQRIASAAEEARVQGYVAGREEGQKQARDEVAQTLVSLTQAAARERERMRGEIAALALEVTRKVLSQLPADGVLVALAESAANDMLPTQTMTLIVHPSRCEAVRERLAEAAAAGGTDAPAVRFEVRGDAACQIDTCLIETEHGSVDASLEAQLERIARVWGVSEKMDELKGAA
jgi:flagellar biosynthesis/type III secretory pathway protein FliH